jgi:predicted NBD/HSP70 family sugar kinase
VAVIVAVDLLPDEARVARVDALGVTDLRTVRAPQSPAEVVDAVRVLAGRQPDDLAALGVALAGPMTTSARSEWPAAIGTALAVPWRAAPRGACLALGERCAGAGQGLDDLLYLRWGDAIEGGAVLGGQPWLRPVDVEHLSLDPRGPRCRCGARGCLAAYIALDALERRASAAGVPGNQPRAGLGSGLHAELAWRAEAGEPSAVALVLTAARQLARAALLLGRALAVHEVVVQLQPPARLHPLVLAEVRRTLDGQAGARLGLRAARLGSDAALVGAAALMAPVG